MIKEIKIGNKTIGQGNPVFIIAEAGVNHNGSLKTALKLIDAAVMAGADAVKFQTFKAEDLVTNRGKMAKYQQINLGKSSSQLEMLKKLELPTDFYKSLIKHCKEKGIIFLSTPHGGFNSVDFLKGLSIPAYKFGSGDLTNLPVLKYAARSGIPMILGTGMATLAEVKSAINTIRKTGNNNIIVLHCTTNYPCPPNEVNLKAMSTMINELPVLVGYSDHTEGIQVPIMAATLGACLIEKHFTLDRNMLGPDHKASLEPNELKDMVDSIRRASMILGTKIKMPNSSETSMIENIRKSIVAAKNIKKGEIFTEKNLAIKRPGTGLSPRFWYKVLGKIAKRNFKNGEFIKT